MYLLAKEEMASGSFQLTLGGGGGGGGRGGSSPSSLSLIVVEEMTYETQIWCVLAGVYQYHHHNQYHIYYTYI
jgi:hypothetical protein